MMQLRAMTAPNDYVAVAALLSTMHAEPLTVADMTAQDAQMPAENQPSADEQGLINGFYRERVVAVDESGQIVGYAAAWRSPWAEPGVLASLLVVAPERRRAGVGTLLLQHLEGWAREIGAAAIVSEMPDQLPESRAFAEAKGYAINGQMFQSTLEVASFEESLFAGVAMKAAQSGIRFVQGEEVWNAVTVQQLYDLFAVTWRDNPGSDIVPTFAEWQAEMGSCSPPFSFFAFDGEQLIGSTQNRLLESGGLYNVYTGVAPTHRGRHIALALKLLLLAEAKRQGVPYLRTDNDAANTPMLAINRQLGFLPAPGHYRVRKNLL